MNSLHRALVANQQVLINPTAIDELRFDEAATGGPSPILTRRWRLPGADLLWIPPRRGRSPDHTELLTGELPPSDPIALGSARSLSMQILSDVAARDHMLVEHTPGLCIYRPFFSSGHHPQRTSGNSSGGPAEESEQQGGHRQDHQPGTDWSGGVRRELEHWVNQAKLPGVRKRRAAFVHTDKEIGARLRSLKDAPDRMDEVTAEVRSHLDKNLRDTGAPKELRRVFFRGGTIDEADFFDRRIDERLLDLAPQIVGWLRSCTAIALFDTFSRLDRPEDDDSPDPARFAIGLFHAKENQAGGVEDLDKLADELCRFFGSSESGEEWNKQFWKDHDRLFGTVFDTDPARFFADRLTIAYEEFVQEAEKRGVRG